MDDETAALRLLADRRDELGAARTLTLNRLLVELIPGGATTFLSADQAKALLATVRRRDVVGTARRQLAADLIDRLTRIDKKIKLANKQLRELVDATGSRPLDVYGIGPSSAARLLGDIGDVARSLLEGTSRRGTAPHRWTPHPATSSDTGSPRAGNRRINRTLHIMAVVQLRHDTEGRASCRRKLAADKTPMEALRALKRRLSDVVYRQLVADDKRRQEAREAGTGGHVGAATDSGAAGSTPRPALRRSHFPDPLRPRTRPPRPQFQTAHHPVPGRPGATVNDSAAGTSCVKSEHL